MVLLRREGLLRENQLIFLPWEQWEVLEEGGRPIVHKGPEVASAYQARCPSPPCAMD